MKRTSLTTAVIAGIAGVAGISNYAGANPMAEVLVYRSPDLVLMSTSSVVPVENPNAWKIAGASVTINFEDRLVIGTFGDHSPDHVGFGPTQLVYTYRPGLVGNGWGARYCAITRPLDRKSFKAITYEA